MIGLINICCDLVRPRKDTRYDDIRYCDPGHRKDNGKPEFANIPSKEVTGGSPLSLSILLGISSAVVDNVPLVQDSGVGQSLVFSKNSEQPFHLSLP